MYYKKCYFYSVFKIIIIIKIIKQYNIAFTAD